MSYSESSLFPKTKYSKIIIMIFKPLQPVSSFGQATRTHGLNTSLWSRPAPTVTHSPLTNPTPTRGAATAAARVLLPRDQYINLPLRRASELATFPPPLTHSGCSPAPRQFCSCAQVLPAESPRAASAREVVDVLPIRIRALRRAASGFVDTDAFHSTLLYVLMM